MKHYLAIVALVALSGCASIASGTSQNIAITSTPTGANCAVSRQGMMIQQVTTPAAPTVQKSKYDLSVECSKSGYATATQVNASGVEPWVFGNILLGGIIGFIIDLSSGAQNHYDTAMSFNLPVTPAAAPVAAEPIVTKQPTT